MPHLKNSRKPLIWQAAVILLPIIALAALGTFYLRQDKLLVRQEAEEQARVLADEVAARLWERLTSPAGLGRERAFRVDAQGNLLDPSPLETAPLPQPLNTEVLTPEQLRLWQIAPQSSATLKQFLAANPPANFAASGTYRLAFAYSAENRVAEAVAIFKTVYEDFPSESGETGLPLGPLAALKALELGREHGDQPAHPLTWETVCRDAIERPTALSSLVLSRAVNAKALFSDQLNHFQALWKRDEALRELHHASRAQLSSSTAALFWIDTGRERSLASRITENATNHWIVFRHLVLAPPPRSVGINGLRDAGNVIPAQIYSTNLRQVGLSFRRDAHSAADINLPDNRSQSGSPYILVSLPDYFGVSIEAAGEPVVTFTNRATALAPLTSGVGQASWRGSRPKVPEVLASARRVDNGHELLKVSIHLVGPELLYARQKTRVLWFSALIAISSVAAIIGLISAWRSFERQQRLGELKDNFVSSVSHELRAPIASVRLMAESLESGRVQEPRKQHEYYHFIVQECRRLSALIQNVLDFSRIDQGRKQYEFESADVLRLVEETVKAMELCAVERQVQLRLAAATSSINAVVDARALQQALVNLIDNAVKHSPAGSEVTIGVSTQSTSVPPALEISVEDQGEGIPKSEHERIFERFYRVGSELRRQTPGAGIGLSIVKHVVDAHGGRVRVQSDPGKGSRFTMEIPLKG